MKTSLHQANDTFALTTIAPKSSGNSSTGLLLAIIKLQRLKDFCVKKGLCGLTKKTLREN